MHKLVSKLMLYRNIGKDSILFRMAEIIRRLDTNQYDSDEMAGLVLDEIYRILDMAVKFEFEGDLWENYLIYLLIMTENPFTISAENSQAPQGTLRDVFLNDLKIFKRLAKYDFSKMEAQLHLNCFDMIKNYKAPAASTRGVDQGIGEHIREFREISKQCCDDVEMYEAAAAFFSCCGVGDFGMHKAFRISSSAEEEPKIIPVTSGVNVSFDDLVGYERQKLELKKNTEMFLDGIPANNVLLYGDAGTGKSTSIKALLTPYYERGLRIIEVYRHDITHLPYIINIIKKRNYKFIIFMDDLSFEESGTEYKYLKAIVEGGVEEKADNVLIYATSNRRHLIQESFSDRSDFDDDLHRSDTISEQMSLYDRFGLTISYFRPEREEYYRIVKALAQKSGYTDISDDELLRKADVWAMRHGGMSGRTADQFINYISGKE